MSIFIGAINPDCQKYGHNASANHGPNFDAKDNNDGNLREIPLGRQLELLGRYSNWIRTYRLMRITKAHSSFLCVINYVHRCHARIPELNRSKRSAVAHIAHVLRI